MLLIGLLSCRSVRDGWRTIYKWGCRHIGLVNRTEGIGLLHRSGLTMNRDASVSVWWFRKGLGDLWMSLKFGRGVEILNGVWHSEGSLGFLVVFDFRVIRPTYCFSFFVYNNYTLLVFLLMSFLVIYFFMSSYVGSLHYLTNLHHLWSTSWVGLTRLKCKKFSVFFTIA